MASFKNQKRFGSRISLYVLVIAMLLGLLGLGNEDKLLASQDTCTTVEADKTLGLPTTLSDNLCIPSGGVGYEHNLDCGRRFVVELKLTQPPHLPFYLVGSEDQWKWPTNDQDLCSKIAVEVTFYTARFFQGWGKRHSYLTRGKWQSGRCERVHIGQPRFYPSYAYDKKIRVAVRASYWGWGWWSKPIPARVNVIYHEQELTCLCLNTNDKSLSPDSNWSTCSWK